MHHPVKSLGTSSICGIDNGVVVFKIWLAREIRIRTVDTCSQKHDIDRVRKRHGKGAVELSLQEDVEAHLR